MAPTWEWNGHKGKAQFNPSSEHLLWAFKCPQVTPSSGNPHKGSPEVNKYYDSTVQVRGHCLAGGGGISQQNSQQAEAEPATPCFTAQAGILSTGEQAPLKTMGVTSESTIIGLCHQSPNHYTRASQPGGCSATPTPQHLKTLNNPPTGQPFNFRAPAASRAGEERISAGAASRLSENKGPC